MSTNSVSDSPVRSALRVLGWTLAVLVPVYAFMVYRAPVDSVQGVMQKILYVHPPLAYGAYLGFVVTAVAGALFLWLEHEETNQASVAIATAEHSFRWLGFGHTGLLVRALIALRNAMRHLGRERTDQLAIAGAEVGTIFCTLMLVTGPIWARGAWGPGNWWVWDARLTLTLLLWFVYLAYILLRSFTEGDERAARFASIYGIVGVLLIPLNYWIIDLVGGRAQHPENIQRGSLGEGMGLPFIVGNLTLFFAFAYLLALRWQGGILQLEADALQAEADAAPGEG